VLERATIGFHRVIGWRGGQQASPSSTRSSAPDLDGGHAGVAGPGHLVLDGDAVRNLRSSPVPYVAPGALRRVTTLGTSGRTPMMRNTRLAGAAAAVAVAASPLTLAGVADAGEGDDRHASVTWDFTFPVGRSTFVTCEMSAAAQLVEFEGSASIGVEDTRDVCTQARLEVVLRYTDRFGNPSTVRSVAFSPDRGTQLVAVADDVEGDMVAEVTATSGTSITSSQTLRPK
jgi:hypothetical protein